MQTNDGRYIITYNGEIYNFPELRKQLQAEGRRFRSRTDTEVILIAFATWGIETTLKRLNGMFAFAMYDKHARKLFLVRDRFGVKPLYYYQNGATLLFASEIKAMIEHPAYRSQLDKEALVEYLTFQNYFTDRTLFKGVRMLPAGTYGEISIDAGGPARTGELQVKRYWDYNFQEPEQPRTEKQYL